MSDFPRTLKIITVWLVLGASVFLGVRVVEQRRQQTSFHAAGGTIELHRNADGHYHWPGSINGHAVDFLVDTGATSTAMSQALAKKLGLITLRHVKSSTAGGVVTGDLVRANLALKGGLRVDRLPITALAGLSDHPLLGMDVLSKLRWQQRDGLLTIDTGTSR